MSRILVLIAFIGACARGSGTTTDSAPVQTVDAAIDSNGCAMQPCSILPQCGCNGNTACDIDLVDSVGTTCRTINAPGTETSACGIQNECDRGYVCLFNNMAGSCKKYCSGDADCTAPRGRCIYTITNAGQPIADIPNACSSNCDPTDTTAANCPSTMKCTLFAITKNSVSEKIVDCSVAGTETQGSDCTLNGARDESQCAKGYQCSQFTSDAANTFKCRRICSAPGTTAGCGGNQCVGFTQPHTVGGTTYGVCGP